ncbi:MAG: oligoendopeptidase F, partial [Hyphomicrobium sp.]
MRSNVLNFVAASGASAEVKADDLGQMPAWNLGDLYHGPDAPEIARDKADAAKEAARMKSVYQGHLADLAKDGAKLSVAVKDYEKLSDLMGKLASYAGLYYAQKQADPVRAKFYGDVSESLTKTSTDLIFFELELNQIDDAVLTAALAHKDLKKYAPWFEDLRKEKPHQLDEKLETLLTEKSQTGRASWTRLFNETMSSLKIQVKGEKEPLGLEQTLNRLSDPDEKKRKAASEALAKTFSEKLPL